MFQARATAAAAAAATAAASAAATERACVAFKSPGRRRRSGIRWRAGPACVHSRSAGSADVGRCYAPQVRMERS